MKDSLANSVLNGVQNRVRMVSAKMAEQYKDVRPFNKVPMTRDEKIRQFDETSPEEFARLRADPEVGEESLMDWAEEIAQLRGGM